jgi:tetratricopeptide (TPR) repeat protein
MQSFEGGRNYEGLAKAAMEWYARGMKLDRYDSYDYLSFGMCLDWLERHDEAEAYFDHANALDPNGYYTAAHVGWHYVQAADYSAARAWLERSLRLHWQENVTASSYLNIAERKLVESASGQSPLPAGF